VSARYEWVVANGGVLVLEKFQAQDLFSFFSNLQKRDNPLLIVYIGQRALSTRPRWTILSIATFAPPYK
jgi:hypothetical protein